jgi:hypothetical protein
LIESDPELRVVSQDEVAVKHLRQAVLILADSVADSLDDYHSRNPRPNWGETHWAAFRQRELASSSGGCASGRTRSAPSSVHAQEKERARRAEQEAGERGEDAVPIINDIGRA